MSQFEVSFLKALHPDYNRSEIQAHIFSTARPAYYGGGWNERYGYGILDMTKAGNTPNLSGWAVKVEGPEKNAMVSGVTPIVVDVNPRLVRTVVVQDEAGNTVATLQNNDGSYLLRGTFDANTLSLGRHRLTMTGYDKNLAPAGSADLNIVSRGPQSTGLQFKVLDPHGRPAKAWLSVFHDNTATFWGRTSHFYEFVWSGETNEAGEVGLQQSIAPDGSDYLVYAWTSFSEPSGEPAGGFYSRTVSGPGRFVLDGSATHAVRFTAQRLAKDGTAVPMDDGYLMGVAANPDGSGQGSPSSALAGLDSKGQALVYLAPGSYNLAAVSWTYNHFLYRPQVNINPFTKRVDFTVDQAAAVTAGGDHAPYLFQGLAMFNGSGMEPFFDLTNNKTAVFTPGNYIAELVEATRTGNRTDVYYLVDGFDPLSTGPQMGTFYGPGSQRVLRDGKLTQGITQNLRSFSYPSTAYQAWNKFTTDTGLWVLDGYYVTSESTDATAGLAFTQGGPQLLHWTFGQHPSIVRLGVPGRQPEQRLDQGVGALGFGWLGPSFTITDSSGNVVFSSGGWMYLSSTYWKIPGNQAAGLYKVALNLDNVGALGGPVYTETALDIRDDRVASGIRVRVKDQAGNPMSSVTVEVQRAATMPDGHIFYQWLGFARTDATGTVRFETTAALADGQSYVVSAYSDRGTPFFVTQTVVGPADVLFDLNQAQLVTMTAQDENGQALYYGMTHATLLDGAGNLVDSWYLNATDSSGKRTVLLTPGATYRLGVVQYGRGYMLTSPPLTVNASISAYTLPNDNLVKVRASDLRLPNGSASDLSALFPIIRNTYIYGLFFDSATVTLNAGDYLMEDLLLSFNMAQRSIWFYWLDNPQAHFDPGTYNLAFGGAISGGISAVQSYLDKGQFYAKTNIHDDHGNALVQVSAFPWGSGVTDDLQNIAKLDADKLNSLPLKQDMVRHMLAKAMGPAALNFNATPGIDNHFLDQPSLKIYDNADQLVTTINNAFNWQFLYWSPPAASTGGTYTAKLVAPIDDTTDLIDTFSFRLGGAWVSPVNFSPRQGRLVIHFNLPQAGTVDVEVQRPDGMAVAQVVDAQQLARGEHATDWTGRGVPDGEYVAVISLAETGQVWKVPFHLKATVPSVPALDAVPAYTNSHSALVTGRAAPGSHIGFRVDGRQVSLRDPVNAGPDGRFSAYVPLGARDGTFFMVAYAYDDAGNTSAFSASARTTVDTVVPQITLIRPLLSSDRVSITDAFSWTLKLRTKGNSQVLVLVTDPDGVATSRTFKVSSNGNLTTSFNLGRSGDYRVHVVATDRAGNISPAVDFTVHRALPG